MVLLFGRVRSSSSLLLLAFGPVRRNNLLAYVTAARRCQDERGTSMPNAVLPRRYFMNGPHSPQRVFCPINWSKSFIKRNVKELRREKREEVLKAMPISISGDYLESSAWEEEEE